jgi:hypothetical protein
MDSEIRSMSNLADLLDPPGFRDPSKPHVTDLIHAVEDLGKEAKPFDYEALPQNVKNIMAMGRIWEALVLRDVVGVGMSAGLIAVTKLVVETDGIIGSPDGILSSGASSPAEIVIEVKCRFSPSNDRFPRDNTRYMQQCKSYCHMTGARKVWMPILYLSTRPPNAEYIIHRFEFTDLEVQENWQMIVNMRDYLARGD